MSETALQPLRRVLLALENADAGQSGFLESSIAIARALDADLAALFIEDTDLLRLAALPFARELGQVSALPRRLQGPGLEQSLRFQARRARESLAMVAAHTSVRWTFEVVRGRMTAVVTQAATQTDLVVFSLAGDPAQRMRARLQIERMLATAATPVLVLPAGATLRPPFTVLYDGSESARRALRLVAQLGRGKDAAPLVVCLLPGPGIMQWRDEVKALLAEAGRAGRLVTLESIRAEALGRVLNAVETGTLVLPVHEGVFHAGRIADLLNNPCAMLFVS